MMNKEPLNHNKQNDMNEDSNINDKYTVRWFNVVDDRAITETIVSGGSINITTIAGNVSGYASPVTSENNNYQQLRLMAYDDNRESIITIPSDRLLIMKGQDLGIVYHTKDGLSSVVALINKATKQYFIANTHKGRLGDSRAMGCLAIIALAGCFAYGVVSSNLIATILLTLVCLGGSVIWIERRNTKERKEKDEIAKSNERLQLIVQEFMSGNSNSRWS